MAKKVHTHTHTKEGENIFQSREGFESEKEKAEAEDGTWGGGPLLSTCI